MRIRNPMSLQSSSPFQRFDVFDRREESKHVLVQNLFN